MPKLSPEVVLALIALLGACLGSFVNWAIYSLAFFNPRPISPWSRDPKGLRRAWLDRIPIIGWLLLRREANVWGRGFWVRPLFLEAVLALGLARLFYLDTNGLLVPVADIEQDVLLAQFFSHAILIVLMTIATFIDFDEKTIPDWITIPGTLLGIVLVTAWPGALPQIRYPLDAPALNPFWITTDAGAWPAFLDGWIGSAIAIACLVAWCYALVPKTTTLRRGWYKGWLYLHASTFRTPFWWIMGLLALVGSLGVAAVWLTQSPNDHWRALLTSLVGMAFGGAIVWAVRIVGYVGLRKEAMGFGDVTLMAMIGAYMGWQSTVMTFFLAPFVAVVIAVAQWAITRRRDIAFGPYLCGGALVLILYWPAIWENYGAIFGSLGWLVPALILCGLALMLGLLVLIRNIEEAFAAWMASKE